MCLIWFIISIGHLYMSGIWLIVVSRTANVPNLVHYLNRAPIYEWYMVNCGIKNAYQKNHVFEEIKSCA